ncbi:MAG: hypothetical protein IPM77_11320 [Crocinitomicaceae bacterium]|nr:hypothetical protein [Crocinitomicaceae bacterium]
MKLKSIYCIFALSLLMTSCKKDINGCTDPEADNFSNAATKDDGSCFFESDAVKSTTVTISNWSETADSWATTIPYGEITADALTNGAILTYLENGTNVWQALPLTTYQSTTYSTTIEVSITVGQVMVEYKNSDGTLPTEPGEQKYKISVVE